MHSLVATGSNCHRYNRRHNNNHRHKLQPQSLDPPTNSKSKNLNKREREKKKKKKEKRKKKKKALKIFNKTPTQQINQTQPTVSDEIGSESCGGRRAKIGDYPWASRASDQRVEVQIGEL